MTTISGIVIVRFDERGEQSFHVIGDHTRLFIVDERCPSDRVYEWLARDTGDEIKAILKDDPIGSSADDRHPAIQRRILSLMDGKKHHLTVVGDDNA